jgi:hypothetical protein
MPRNGVHHGISESHPNIESTMCFQRVRLVDLRGGIDSRGDWRHRCKRNEFGRGELTVEKRTDTNSWRGMQL